jgi:transcriptional regulator with XRE-family HTH domain
VENYFIFPLTRQKLIAYLLNMKFTKVTRQEVLRELEKRSSASNVAALAREIGVSPVYVRDVLRGDRLPGPAILAYLGIEYQHVKEGTFLKAS